jgi:hypothetical protein
LSFSPSLLPLSGENMQNINGIEVDDPVPSCAGDFGGTLLILGGGKCLWEDYLKFKELGGSYRIMAVNDIACQFKAEPIMHAISLHRGILPAIRLMRREKSMLEHVFTHCHKSGPGIDNVWNIHNVGGTSGLFAIKVAMCLGHTKIVVAGVPMDGSGHYFDPLNANENNTTRFDGKSSQRVWSMFRTNNSIAGDRVRSMSGHSKTVFGEPTIEWLRS